MVRLSNQNNTLIAELSGEIDHHTARSLREEIDSNLQRSLPGELILDFSGVTFMDSSGIGLVMGRYKLIKSMGGSIVIRNVSDSIARVMRLAGLDRLADIRDESKTR